MRYSMSPLAARIGPWLALICTFGSIISTAHAKRKLKEQEIIQRILNNYDWRVRPRGLNASWPDTGGPVLVTVNIYLRSISKIDDVNMEYSAQFTFREEWVDARLAYGRFEDESTEVPPFVVLATSENADQSQQIWMPDTFFQNEKEARRHLIDKPNVLIRIHKDGSILYSVRLSLVLSCPMSLEFYPLDRQNCLIDLASYAYTTQDIKYEWKATNPVQQKDGLRQSLPSFELQDVVTKYCTSKTNTGEYSCLRTQMVLRREFSYYLLQLYIPSFMLVIVSWVSFWLDKDSVPARVTLGVTTLLTMTTQASRLYLFLCHPYVLTNCAIDVWIGVCLAFIFGALLEFALVNYAARKDMTNCGQRMMKQLPQDGYRPLSINQPRSSFCCRIFVRRYKERSKRIDVVSRLVFPIGYACFNVLYWAVYLICARVKLLLRREYSYYLIQLYIPCIMLVVVSWVSFWLDKDAVPARVSLGVTTLLTMTTQASGINSKLPPVSYIKAVDVWIGVCLAFIFGALLEYAVVNYYGRKEFLRKEKKKKTRLDDCVCPSEQPALRLDLSSYRRRGWAPLNRLLDLLGRKADLSRRVDLMSRITFPSLFTAFLVFYYSVYVKQSNLEN
ncbi:hypothetical protein Q1695_008960 [Nippostrongylus brasiliensis]|nr:hypothetical protein Q1695_008960 [Nippostrongylus brasiliensis]